MNKQPVFAILHFLEDNQKKDPVALAKTQTLLAQCMAEAFGTFGLVLQVAEQS